MKRILFFFSAILFLSSGNLFSQGSSCANATAFCGNSSFANNTSTTSQSGPSYGCLGSQPNPAWFFIKTTGTGPMNYTINQVNGGGTGIDVDFIAWGPFTSMANACNNLTGSCFSDHDCTGLIEDCSYSTAAVENMQINSAGPGLFYVILITNYADQAGTITFTQNTGPPSDCSITCPSVTSGNGFVVPSSTTPVTYSNVPATVACSAAPIVMQASPYAPFGNPITPGIMISFTSNANNTLQINWYENGGFILCSGPVGAGCQNQIPTNYDNDIQYSTMSPSATNQIEFCETTTTGGDIPYTITDVSSGTVINSGTWTTNAGCTTVTIPPGTITGVSSWTISPACPGCLATTDWGAAQFNPGVAPAGTYSICYSFDPPGTCPTYTYCQSITVTNPNNPAWTTPPAMCANASSINLNTFITGTTGGTWSGTGVSGSTFNPATSGAGTFNITYTVGSGTCAASQVHAITVNPVPSVSITPASATVCAGQSVTLNASPSPAGGTYLWSPGGSTSSGITVSPGSSTTYTVTYSLSGCTATATRLITVNPVPTVSVTSPAPVCAGNSGTLTANPSIAGGTYSWSPGGTTAQTLTASPGSTTSYTVTYTLSGCSNTGVGTITVNPVPTVGITASATTVCAGQSTTLTANPSTGGGTYLWAPGGSTASAITVSPGASTTYTVTYTLSGCTATATRLITVNPVPTVSVTSPPAVCAGNSATLTANPSIAGGTYSWSPGGSTAQTLTASPASTTSYTVTYTLSGCTNTGVGTITVNPIPTVSINASASSICAGQSTTLTANPSVAGGTYAWAPGGASTNAITVSPGSNTTYTVTYTLSGCTATSASLITVNAIPAVSVNTPPAICAGSSATLIASPAPGGGTYSWSPGGATTQSITVTPAFNTTYTVTYTLSGCSGTGTGTVTVNPMPTVGITPATATICAGQSSTLNASPSPAGGTYSWSPGGATTSSITVSPAASTTYTVTYTLSGCIATNTRLITVNPMDNANFNYGGSTTFCQTGTNPNAVITGLAGGTFTSSPGGLSINPSTGTINLAASALNTYNVTYNTNGPCPNSFTLPVTITSAPSASFTYAGPYCQSASNPLPTFGAGASGGTFTSTAGLNFVNVNTGQINLSTSTPGTYTVTNSIAAGGGCSAATATASVTITPSPVVTATPASQTICSGTATGIALSSSIAGTTYNWTVSQSGVSGASAGSGSSIAQTLSTTGAVAGTATYTITSSAGGCAGNTLTVTITVNPVPTATPSPVAQTICSGNTTSISLTGNLPGTTFAWAAPTQTGATGGAAGTGTSIVQALTATGAGAGTVTYNIIPTANSCPGSSVPVIITVNPAPAITATPAAATICSGAATSVNLTSTVAGTTFTWVASNGAGISGASAGSGSSINQTLTNSSSASGTATYTVTPSASGCPGTPTTVTITVNPIPTVTPSPTSQTICSGSVTSINLSGSLPGTTFAWGAPTQSGATGGTAGSGASIAQTLLTSGASAGTVTYNIVPSANSCTGPAVPVVITVSPVPFATATPSSATICSGASTAINLSSFTSGTTFTWTAGNGAGISGASAGSGASISQILTNSGTAQGTATYTVTPSASGCPGNPITVTITVNPVPGVTATPPGQSICSGNTTAISLSSSVAGATFSWAAPTQSGASGGAAGSGASIAQTLTATGASAGTVTYNIIPTANSCPGTPLAVSVTINPNPVGTATPASASICSGTSTSVVLSSTIAGTTYSWTASASGASGESAGSGNTISQVLTATGTSSGTVTYIVTATTPAGCSSTMAPVVITVNPTPNVSATPASATICSGSATAVALTSNVSGTTFSWTVSQSDVSGAAAGSGSSITQTLTATGTVAGSAVYTITPSASGCASGSPVTATITVNPLPVATATSSTQDICDGSTINIGLSSNLGATTYSWTVVQTGVTGASAGSGNSISQLLGLTAPATAGSAIYTVTPSDNGCAGTPVTITVNVNPIDNAAFSYSSSTFCITGTDPSAVITGTPGGIFSFSPTGLSMTDTQTGLIDLSASTLGSYNITYQTNGACPSSSVVIVTITNAPSAVFSYTSVCSTDPNPVPLFGAGASAGMFTASPAGIVFIDPATGEIDLITSTPGSYLITNSITAGGGCAAATASDSITIDQAATVDAGVSDTICELETITLAAIMGGSAGTVTWTTNGTGTFNNANSPSAVYTPSSADITAGTAVLTVTTDDPIGGCASVTDFMVLTITPLDSADFTYSGSTFCQSGTNPVPVVAGVPGGMFTASPAGLVFVNALTGEIDLSSSVLGTYDVVYSTNGPCPSSDTASITISDAPEATFTFSNTTTSFCQSDANPVPVFATGASAGAFTANPAGLVFVSTSTGEVDLQNSTPGTYTIINNIVAAGGCASAVDSLVITIDQPATVDAGPDATVCAGTVYSITGASIGGAATSSVWTTSGSGTFNDDSLLTAVYTPSAADTASGTVVLYLTSNDPAGICSMVADSMVLTITPLPQTPVVTNPAPYCAGAALTPVTFPGSGGTVTWYSDAALTNSIGTGNPFTPTGITATDTIYVTETVGSCGSVSSQVIITFNPVPVADSSTSVISGATCGQSTGSITNVTIVSGQAPLTYLWEDASGNTVGTSLDLTNVGPGVYTLTITDANGCTATLGGGNGTTVTSTSGVTASFTSDVITGEKPLPVSFTNTSIGGVSYTWMFPDGTSSNTLNASFVFTELGMNTICLVADNGVGCADTACAEIDVFQNSVFVIPNVFTPNGDDVNDVFTVKNVGLETMDAQIFNRWGQKQYEWHTTNGGWDGRTASGVIVPDGTYYFMISAKGYDGKEYFEKGSFELIR